MKSFKQFLEESFVNSIGKDNFDKREKYLDQVWNILQSSYASIGGLKGSGFENAKSMLNLPFWKMAVKDGKVLAVVIYKDKGGRKSVASGTDGSHEGKRKIIDMMKSDLERSFGEKSKASLGALLKNVPEDVIKQFLKTPEEASKILKDDSIVPLSKFKGTLPEDAVKTIDKYPYVKPFGYFRDIGGSLVFKVMVGTPGKSIR